MLGVGIYVWVGIICARILVCWWLKLEKKKKKRTGGNIKLCCCSVAKSCPTLCDSMDCRLPCPSLFPELSSNSCPLSQWGYLTISSSAAHFSFAFSLTQHQSLFQWVNSSHNVAKVWSFSFSISPSNEYSGLISFRMDWSDLPGVQGTLKSLL